MQQICFAFSLFIIWSCWQTIKESFEFNPLFFPISPFNIEFSLSLTSYKLIYCKLFRLLNIFSISWEEVIFCISNFDISRKAKFSQESNIWYIFVTEEVSNLDNSNDTNSLHPWNIEFILDIKEVLNLDKSNDFNALHPWNIELISFTEMVSNSDKFNDSNALHPLKRLLRSVIKEVFKWVKSIEIILMALLSKLLSKKLFKLMIEGGKWISISMSDFILNLFFPEYVWFPIFIKSKFFRKEFSLRTFSSL